jgi:hypothetical protein
MPRCPRGRPGATTSAHCVCDQVAARGQGGGDPRLGLFVRYGDVEVDAVALRARCVLSEFRSASIVTVIKAGSTAGSTPPSEPKPVAPSPDTSNVMSHNSSPALASCVARDLWLSVSPSAVAGLAGRVGVVLVLVNHAAACTLRGHPAPVFSASTGTDVPTLPLTTHDGGGSTRVNPGPAVITVPRVAPRRRGWN